MSNTPVMGRHTPPMRDPGVRDAPGAWFTRNR